MQSRKTGETLDSPFGIHALVATLKLFLKGDLLRGYKKDARKVFDLLAEADQQFKEKMVRLTTVNVLNHRPPTTDHRPPTTNHVYHQPARPSQQAAFKTETSMALDHMGRNADRTKKKMVS